MYYIPQLSTNDCGLACLKMTLATINEDEGFLFLPLKEKKGQYSYKEIIDIASEYSLNLKGFKVEEKEEILKCDRFPLIVSFNLENGLKHSVIITKIKHRTIYVLNPSNGKETYSFNKFSKLWDGTGLIIEKFKNIESQVEVKKPYKKKDMFFACTLELFTGLSLILGSMFMNNDSSFYIPIFFCLMSFIFEILLRITLTRIMKKMDSLFFENIEVQKGMHHDFFIQYQEYKKDVLMTPIRIIFMVIMCLFIATITIINSPYNLVAVAIPLCFATIDMLVFNPYFKNKDANIAHLENDLVYCDDMQDFYQKTDNISENAYKSASLLMLRKYIYLALMVVTAILTAYISKIMNIPSVVFFVCVEATLYEYSGKLFNYEEKKKNTLIAQAKMHKTLKAKKD